MKKLASEFSRFAQHSPHDFPRGGQRQLVEELDEARIFMGREPRLDETLNVPLQVIARHVAGAEDEAGFDHLAAQRVRHADDRRQRDRRVPGQAVLDLGGADAVAGAS